MEESDGTQKKKIAFLINSLEFGGAQRVFVDDANEFVRAGFDVTFFVLYDGKTEQALVSELNSTVKQVFLNAKSPYDVRAITLCLKELRLSNTCVLISTLNDANRVGQFVALFSGLEIKLIEREANTLKSKTFLQKTLDALFFWVPYRIIALSTEIQRSLMHLLPFSHRKIILLPNAIKVPDESHANARTIQSDANQSPLILSVGRLTEQKNYELLIQAVASLQKKGFNFLVEIVGEGILRADLEKRIREAGLEKIVSLPGHLPHEQVLERYEKADIFVSTSRWEGSPNVVLEALSYGLPVVATRVGGVSDIIKDGVQGLLVSSGNKEELESALERLLKDGELREKLGTAARERVQKDFSKEARFARLRAIVEAAK
jgi:glycosyltransferase involved in cell wall biosynthesis